MSDDKALITLNQQYDVDRLIHFTQGALQKAIAEIPPEYNGLSEKALEAMITPTELDYLLRSSFSREIERVKLEGGGVLKASDIYGDFCSKVYFYTKFIRSKYRLAWMIRPMPKYEKFMEAMLFVSNKRLWELLNVPIKVKGKVQPRLCDVVLSACKMIKETVKGMPVQRSETKSLTLNVDASTPARVHDMSMEQLEKEIKRLEKVVSAHDGTQQDRIILSAGSNDSDLQEHLPQWSDKVES